MENPSQETRTALLRAALTCFAEKGFDGTSMRMIAERAKRPLSLLTHHFGSKEGLYTEVFRMILRRPQEEVADDAAIDPRNREEAIRCLREQVHRLYEAVVPGCGGERDELLRQYGPRLWLQEMQSTRAELVAVLHEYLGPKIDAWRRILKCLQPELTEAEVAGLGISIIGMVAAHGMMSGVNRIIWGDERPVKNPFQISELMVDLCLRGLLGGPVR